MGYHSTSVPTSLLEDKHEGVKNYAVAPPPFPFPIDGGRLVRLSNGPIRPPLHLGSH